MRIGHVAHLVQIPRAEADAAASFAPGYWTVFNHEKAIEAARASAKLGRRQDMLARIQTEGDRFYRGHEGGFDAGDATAVADAIDALPGARFAGVTTFPALLFDQGTRKVAPTPNLTTIRMAAEALAKAGRTDIAINAPGTTSSVLLAALAEAGTTQVEPGHGLTGTTPLHAVEDLPELPAVVYVSEVSHYHGSDAYCFGGGLYIDPIFPDYPVRAVVSSEPTVAARNSAARGDRLLRHDRLDVGRDQAGGRRHRRVRVPPAGFRHARLYLRRLGPFERRCSARRHSRCPRPPGRVAALRPRR
jgi:predicted amino acid racemase